MIVAARLIIRVAIALSPPSHRALRREQWSADLLGARELELSPLSLAFGTLVTALFHRSAVHRTSWGKSMPDPKQSVACQPHVLRTIPLLVVITVVALFAAGGWIILQPNYGYANAVDRWIGMAGTSALFYVIPGAAIVFAVLVLRRGSARRRQFGASMVAAAALGSLVAPYVLPSFTPTVLVAPMLALGGWLLAAGGPRWRWLVLAGPVLMVAVLESGLVALVPTRLYPFLLAAPSLVAVACGVLVTAPRSSAPASTPEPLPEQV